MIFLSLPKDRDRDRDVNKWDKRKNDRKQSHRKEEKGWRNQPKKGLEPVDVDLEDLMMKINQQFRCNKCQSISSIYAPVCSVCDTDNPTYIANT